MFSKSTVKVQIIGRLGKKPELQKVANDKAVVNLSVATNEFYSDKEVTTWHYVAFWGGSAELVERHLNKGDMVLVNANLSYKAIPDSPERVAILTGTEFTVLVKADHKEEGQ